jgi:hypothetical protein
VFSTINLPFFSIGIVQSKITKRFTMIEDSDQSWSVEGGNSSEGEIRSSNLDTIEKERSEEAAVAELIRHETRLVQMWRVFTLLILVAVSVAVSTITFRLLQNQDVDEFEDSVSVTENIVHSVRSSRRRAFSLKFM